MYKPVAEIQQFLMEKLGSSNVYLQSPSSVNMHYPAFKYNLAKIDDKNADNIKFLQAKAYTLTYITEDPDDPMVEEISKWTYCSFDRWYPANNLNHFVYTFYY